MTNRNHNQKGFTLIELIVVIAVLGILAGVAVPKFINVTAQAQQAAARADIGAIKAGALNLAAQNAATSGTLSYPASLGAVPAAAGDPVFVNVLEAASAADMAQRGWSQTSTTAGTFGSTGISFTYTPATGVFQVTGLTTTP